MKQKNTYLYLIFGLLLGMVTLIIALKFLNVGWLQTKHERSLNASLDSLRTVVLRERLDNDLVVAKFKVVTNDFKDDKEKVEMQGKVYAMEEKILNRASTYSELEIVVKNIMITSPNFRSIPAIIPLRPGTFKRLSSGYGYREHPVLGGNRLHTGIDISAIKGTQVYAPADGVVTRVDPEWTKSGYGNRIVIKHRFGFQTLYGHLSQFAVKVNDKVKVGEVIGWVGNTGISSGPHLHYEIIKNGKKIDPIQFTLITARKLQHTL